MSILNSLKDLASNQLVSGVASHLGESQEGVSKALGGIFPTLLSSMMGAKQEDHSMLSGLLSQAGSLGSSNIAGDLLGGLTGGNTNSGISGIGSSLVSGLLGNKLGGAVDMISKFSGLKSGSTSSLMGVGGSLLASFLGSKMTGGMNFGGIMNMIAGHKDEIAKAAPAGFASTLGLGNLFGDATTKVTNAVNATTGAVSSAASSVSNAASSITGGDDDNKGGGMKWLWPLLLLLGLAAAAMWFMKGCKKDGDNTANVESTTPAINQDSINAATATVPATGTETATATTATTVAPAKESIKVKLADGVEINAYKGGVEDKMNAFLNDASSKLSPDDKSKDWFDFDNLNFDLGKATITKESMVQVDNLAAILKAYPKLKIKVGGYTDKSGNSDANLKLSQSRAEAVFAALKAKGANVAQLVKAEGYGDTLAKEPATASDEARRADRKTAVRILEK